MWELCYSRVKCPYFGKAARGNPARTYASGVESSMVEASVTEPPTSETGPSTDRAAARSVAAPATFRKTAASTRQSTQKSSQKSTQKSTQKSSSNTAPAPEVRRKRGRPRDPQADGRILAAASSLILMRGFESMTVDEVASNAGVGKATVYRRWSRKEDLAVAA